MFWKVKEKAWLRTGLPCWIFVGSKATPGTITQANGDISCVETDDGRNYLRENSSILVRIDGVYMIGHG